MRYSDDRTRIALKMVLKPCYSLGVEMVRRLVKEKYIRLLKEQPAQGHAALFAS